MSRTRYPKVPPGTLPTLTLHQPWATLIAESIKTIETRSWLPPPGLIGQRFAIHAGAKKVSKWGVPKEIETAMQKVFTKHDPSWDDWRNMKNWQRDLIPYGGIVCTATLSSASYIETNTYKDGAPHLAILKENGSCPIDPYGDFRPGRTVWLFSDIRQLFPPYQVRGRQRIWYWEYPPELPSYHTKTETE